ncbi:MAG TPA: S1 RNA-binding domain-containing protein [Candidatus Caenarcaniphilales bacterium]
MNQNRAQPSLSFSSDDFAQALSQHDYAFQQGQVVRGKAFNYEREGAYIDIGGKAAAFLPVEEASLRPSVNWSQMLPLQEERDFLIIGDQNADGQVTLSIKRLEIKALWERLLEMQLNHQSIQVRVSGVNKGGVTVDVQGLRGFIPRSHLLERDNLEALKEQTLTASFLEVDPQRQKLVLSHRLGSRSAQISQLEIGQLVEGKITKVQPFGVFVDFAGGTGLLHIKEVSQQYVKSLSEIFQLGEAVKAVIIEVDHSRGRVSLSTKVLENQPGEMLEHKAHIMAEAEARAQRYQGKLQ